VTAVGAAGGGAVRGYYFLCIVKYRAIITDELAPLADENITILFH
jgi:hypothetical protein